MNTASETPDGICELTKRGLVNGFSLIDFCTGSGDALRGLLHILAESGCIMQKITVFAFDSATTPYIDEHNIRVVARKQKLNGFVEREWSSDIPSIGIISYADLYNTAEDYESMIMSAFESVDMLMIMPAEQSKQDSCLFIAKTENGIVDFVVRRTYE